MKLKHCGLVCAALAGPAMALDQWLIWRYAPLEEVMGLPQKIFYLHVPLAWWSLVAFLLAAVAGGAYLRTRRRFWDNLGLAAMESGLLLATLALATGAIWGRYAWGVWWTADPKLITFLILWFTYAGCLALRGAENRAEYRRKATFSAVLSIIAFLNVPLVFFATRLLNTVHPNVIAGRTGGLAPEMLFTLLASLAALGLTWLGILILRLHLAELKNESERMEYFRQPLGE